MADHPHTPETEDDDPPAEPAVPAPDTPDSLIEPAAAEPPPGTEEAVLEQEAAEALAEEPSPPPKPAPNLEPPKAEAVKPKPDEDSWVEITKTVVYALLIAFVIRTFLFQPFNIPSGSMENTLLVGDYLFVEKYVYGYSRYSFPWGLMPFSGRVFGSEPKRGDVVVFKLPSDNSTDFIKRVVGLPGDRIQMLNGQLYINDKPVPKVRGADWVETIDGYTRHVPRYRETLPGGKSYYVLDSVPDGPGDNTDVFVVPPGHYFMMGDNRDNSADSRTEVGYVPAQNLVGKAELIFFSVDETGVWYEPWTWPAAIRYARIFTVID